MTDLVDRLNAAAEAYPADIFPPLTPEQTKEHAAIVTRASAQMGRHFSPMLAEAAETIAAQESELTTLRQQLEAAQANEAMYLWLRDKAQNADRVPFIAQRDSFGIMQWSGDLADAAIHAARTKELPHAG